MNHPAIDITAVPIVTPASDSNAFQKLEISNVILIDRSLAWSIHSDTAPDLKSSLVQQMEDYNFYLTRMECADEFTSTFIKNGCIMTRDEIAENWSPNLADFVFKMKNYPFVTTLAIMGDTLFAPGITPKYDFNHNGKTVTFSVGESNDGYPIGDAQCQYLWDWSDDNRDFTFYLYQIFSDNNLIPENVADDYEFSDYDEYGQARDLIEEPHPKLMACLDALVDAGYLKIYRIVTEPISPWLVYRGRSDGTLGFGALQMEFLDDETILTVIQELLL